VRSFLAGLPPRRARRSALLCALMAGPELSLDARLFRNHTRRDADFCKTSMAATGKEASRMESTCSSECVNGVYVCACLMCVRMCVYAYLSVSVRPASPARCLTAKPCSCPCRVCWCVCMRLSGGLLVQSMRRKREGSVKNKQQGASTHRRREPRSPGSKPDQRIGKEYAQERQCGVLRR
jgi:hypothetical protein